VSSILVARQCTYVIGSTGIGIQEAFLSTSATATSGNATSLKVAQTTPVYVHIILSHDIGSGLPASK
jgi:hypothetical protein